MRHDIVRHSAVPFHSICHKGDVHSNDTSQEGRLESSGQDPELDRSYPNLLVMSAVEERRVQQMLLEEGEDWLRLLEESLGVIVEACQRSDIPDSITNEVVEEGSDCKSPQDDDDIGSEVDVSLLHGLQQGWWKCGSSHDCW